MQCERCQGDCWDNQEEVANGRKGPIFRCKDKECGWAKWPPRTPGSGFPKKGAVGPPPPKMTWKSVAAAYKKAIEVAQWGWGEVAWRGLSDADRCAAAATVLIAADKGGLTRPAVVEPKPPSLHEVPPALVDQKDDLPF